VIGFGAADEPDARTLASGAVIGARDLQSRIDGLRTGIGEENMVEARRRDLRNAPRQFERRRMAHLERGDEVQPFGLCLDGIDDSTLAMPCVDAPQPRHRVENAPAV
jgi:hypothetical protein